MLTPRALAYSAPTCDNLASTRHHHDGLRENANDRTKHNGNGNDNDMADRTSRRRAFIKCAIPIVMAHTVAVLTGAGISTSAGIPDFRGPDGVWTKHPDQMKVYDIDAYLSDTKQREYSWRWQQESPVWNAEPGSAHKALAKLERAGMLNLLATQNFDALHEKAGNTSATIINLHGTIGTSHCMRCHAQYETAQIMDRLDVEPDPHCHRRLPYQGNMVCNGILKTDVVYFGEMLPEGAIETSMRKIAKADEFWVIGSTLEVFPAASLVPAAAQDGVPITIMNMGATQYDRLATRRIHEDIATALPELVDTTIRRYR